MRIYGDDGGGIQAETVLSHPVSASAPFRRETLAKRSFHFYINLL